MEHFDVVGIGGVTVDHLTVVDKFPKKDTKIIPLWSSMQGGGQAATAIAQLGRLGVKTALIGTVGEGPIGQFAIETMQDEGVNADMVRSQDGHAPALSNIIVEDKLGSRTIISDRGGLSHIPLFDEMYEMVKNAKYIHTDAHFPKENLKLVKFAKEHGVKICLDAEPHTPNVDEFVKLTDILIVSRRFVERDFGHEYEKALRSYIDGGAEIAIITLGKYGSIGMHKDNMEIVTVPIYPIEPVVDTTGAGDVFHGAFLYGMLEGFDLRKSMKFATICSGLKCLKIGGRMGMPTLDQAVDALEKWDV